MTRIRVPAGPSAFIPILIASSIASAQSDPNICTTQSKSIKWDRDTVVSYSFDSTVPPGHREEFRRALATWQADSTGRRSNITFNEQPEGVAVKYRITADLTYANSGKVASTYMASSASAVTTFFLNHYPEAALPSWFWYNGTPDFFYKIALHEIGHTFGFADQLPVGGCWVQQPQYSVMNIPCFVGDGYPPPLGMMPTTPSQCDTNTLRDLYPPPPPPSGGGGGGGPIDGGGGNEGCGPRLIGGTTQAIVLPCTPILIDTAGDGFELTSADEGVRFDLAPGGDAEVISWTSGHADDSWLILDRNHNGNVDDGTELFGNFTPQPLSSDPNGFRALQYYDTPAEGGNADGMIGIEDLVYSELKLWQDVNHDGIANDGELSELYAHGILGIYLDYRLSRRVDEYGNAFRYVARILRAPGSRTGPFAVDVFLVSQ